KCSWCNKCGPSKNLIERNNNRNSEMDKLIIYGGGSQQKARNYDDDENLEWIPWIPYDRLQDITPIGEGGFANIYSAIWLDGKPTFRTISKKKRTEPVKVALKKLKDSNNNMEAFINEVKKFFKSNFIHLQYLILTLIIFNYFIFFFLRYI